MAIARSTATAAGLQLERTLAGVLREYERVHQARGVGWKKRRHRERQGILTVTVTSKHTQSHKATHHILLLLVEVVVVGALLPLLPSNRLPSEPCCAPPPPSAEAVAALLSL